MRLHPASSALKELEEQIRLSPPAEPSPAPMDLTPPAAPPEPEPSQPPEPAIRQAGAELMRRDLAAQVERRVSLEKKELERASRTAVAEEESRLAERRLAERRAIVAKRRAVVSDLESSIALLKKRLEPDSLALGERGQIEERIRALEAELKGLREQEDQELAAVEDRYQQAVQKFRAERARQDEAELAAARAALEKQFSRALKEQTAPMERVLAPPEARTPPAARLKPAQVPQVPQPVRLPHGERKDELRAEYRRLRESIRRETAQAAKALAAQHHVRLILDRAEKKSLPDATAEVSSWLKSYWSAHSFEKEATRP